MSIRDINTQDIALRKGIAGAAMTALVVHDATGTMPVNLSALPHVAEYKGPLNQVSSVTVGPDHDGNYYKQTYAYTGILLTGVSAWTLTSGFADDFNDNSRDTAMWSTGWYEGYVSTGMTVAEVNNQLKITPAISASGNVYGGYLSVQARDFTASSVFVRLVQRCSTTVGAESQMTVYADSSNSVAWIVEQGNLRALKKVAGTGASIFSTAYDANAHAWLRIRESGGFIYWDTAPSTANNPPLSSEWVNQTSLATPFTITATRVNLGAGTYQPLADGIATIYDGFNTRT